ncbi:thiamine pyrophosphate-dependent dehydrogenase E1 component subunit alpha [Pseudomonas sp. BN415]|uniref:thiamine pyrophosphate-dependent dehydrogenase E1 component subunit alpha n=1 Tax=Pseudomonas sp. BN415 TaxID=2567889 RepID=UPI0024577B92|nr:thiamine pyrophosphate-dependent dehydrogenase E1 component subunit alpha [Pseudomonas sp. BN415]MDH4580756.1 thiamine pyrophosphate-dependent dehydrogenase E1 component subunit alpha [Pseudomonas sp. BN415]
MSATKEQLVWMYRQMVLIRHYEDAIAMVYFEGKLPPKIQKGLAFDIGAGTLPGEMHLSAGQEAAAVGICAHLRQNDSVWGTHRSHHFAIAKGVPLDRMTAEIFGKVEGLCRGKGGHMHLYDPENHFASNGIVGAGIPHACGAAWAAQYRQTGAVAIAEFGEGATNQGAFHEALNLASLWKLPVIFVCQDNNYGISVSKKASTSVANIADRAAAYNMPGTTVEENDASHMFAAAGPAIDRARAGDGPSLIEVKVDRYYGHFQGDPETYRPKGEVKALKANDPILRLERQLLDSQQLSGDDVTAIRTDAKAQVDAAIAFARAGNYPDPTEVARHVFAV